MDGKTSESNRKRKFRSRRRHKKRFFAKRPKETQDLQVSNSEEGAPVEGNVIEEEEQQPEILIEEHQSDSDPPALGASERKLGQSPVCSSDVVTEGFRLIHVGFLEKLLEMVVCKRCKNGGMKISENFPKKMGLAGCFTIQCSSCSNASEMYTSPKCEGSKGFEINSRAVLGMQEIGGGKTSLEKLCGFLNMPKAMTDDAYNNSLKKLKDALEKEALCSMKRAVEEEHEALGISQDNIGECNVMFDGTWRKRGFSSLQGAVTAISAVTGKCIDYECLNKVCYGCARHSTKPDSASKDKWLADHKCSINFKGSAPAMEPEGVCRIYSKSEPTRNLQYTGYIGDGDSKSFSTVKSKNPYGTKDIRKFECVGHVQKRMGTALRKLKTTHGKKKLSDGKTIGGAGRLTGARMEKLQVYYGLAIRRNKGDLAGMKKEIMAGLFHSASTDEKPQHHFCPNGPDTWCKFNKAKQDNKEFEHKNALPNAVFNELQQVYTRLTEESLLKGCLGGYTQNNCEAINHLIWSRCPKTNHSGRDHLDSALAAAVISFNDGLSGITRVLQNLGIEPGENTLRSVLKTDRKRKRESANSAKELQKKIRQSRRKRKKQQEDINLNDEGVMYEAGGF